LTTHPNQWVQFTSQPQSVVQSQRDQDEARTSIVLNQL
jgi:UV DNA damage repair endonuclease